MTLEQLKTELEELTKSTWTLIDGWVLVDLLHDPLLLPKIHKLARAREAEVFYSSQVQQVYVFLPGIMEDINK